jgi:hypothetical protein
MAEKYGGPVNKHQELAQTGHVEGYAKGGSVHHSKTGHTTMKHEHKGHGKHGHRMSHDHHMRPGHGETGHKGTDGSIHSLVSHGKNTPESLHGTYTAEPETDGGGHHSSPSSAGSSTGGTRNRI